MLKAGGVAGIILPVSVLNKDGIYAKAREILLQKFDIVALVEFGSGTFGKTGTSTITMFLRRKETNTPDAEHYLNRVDCWFCNYEKCESNVIYDDTDLLMAYCEHCGYEWDDYLAFLSGNMTERFKEHDTIQAYRTSFFDIRTRFLGRQNTQAYRRLAEDEKKKQEEKAFLQFVIALEKEKVYYFILAKTSPNPVVIVKSPSGTTNVKRFLGYEWSDSKGNEGIKYLNVTIQNTSDEEGNGEEDDTLLQIDGIKGIQTPLFNPHNLQDGAKINSIIRQNFVNCEVDVPDELMDYVEVYNLADLIDFKRTDFSKAIKTTPVLSYPQIVSKYPLEKLGVIAPYVSEKVAYSSILPSSYITTKNMLQNRAGVTVYTDTPEVENVTKYQRGDILVSNIRHYLKKIWFADHEGGCSNDVLVFRNLRPSEYSSEYLYTILSSDIFFDYMMVGKTGLKMPRGDKKIIPNFLIPKAPRQDVQESIVAECKEQDRLYSEASSIITQIEMDMEELVRQSQMKAQNSVSLSRSDLFEVLIGRRVLKSEIVKDGEFDVYSANVFEPFGKTLRSVLSDFSRPSVLWGIDGDWMVGYQEAEKPFNPTDHCGVIRVLDESVANPRYLVYPLLKAGEAERFSRSNRASTERVKSLSIMLPDVATQNDVARQLIEKENEIARLIQQMKDCLVRKQEILNKYLK